ncbi:bifunctional phosphoribosylaminoimidazolecarboxamide formyltransferase/IMP cyclohydrolase [Candidatus Peregrinibacteria bacterium]|nr:bifunctional phosphoribosylaminoimidazolecarboxamide formyltransferase/IMP cyclohydrolase [Candidatus Peregrinibacteria bacterium]
MQLKRALISVSDKQGVAEFVKGLSELGVEILSTGGTAKVLKEAGVSVLDVADYTGFPEMMGGRVKTLHPKVHGGILALREDKKHKEEAEKHEIHFIDLVVVNLYPFEAVIAKEGVNEEEAIENIDIGGPSMIRSAAKNFKYVTVVVDNNDFERVLSEIRDKGETSLNLRKELARKAFSLTYRYDEAIEQYFRKILNQPELLNLHYEKICSLRYGENPHQKAAFFKNPENYDSNITNSEVLHGKQLSFNNLVDGDSALELVKEFDEAAAVFVKHNNPCGVATAKTIKEAFWLAHGVDELSAFGCIIALNREVTEEIVDYMKIKKMFVEVIIAPSYSSGALKRLKTRENLRILRTGELKLDLLKTDIKKVAGGLLIQTKDTYILKREELVAVTVLKPSEDEIDALLFANKVVKHVMSNAVIMAKKLDDGAMVITGVGAGQMSRIDSVRIACLKGGDNIAGSVMASDAFFPFSDAMEEAYKAGVKVFSQTGGSVNDKEVIKRADELKIRMVFTGRRYFRH